MGEKMTLEQVRDWHRRFADTHKEDDADEFHNRCADAIDAHLTQQAQAVDVEKVRAVEYLLLKVASESDSNATRVALTMLSRRLTSALPNANGEVG